MKLDMWARIMYTHGHFDLSSTVHAWDLYSRHGYPGYRTIPYIIRWKNIKADISKHDYFLKGESRMFLDGICLVLSYSISLCTVYGSEIHGALVYKIGTCIHCVDLMVISSVLRWFMYSFIHIVKGYLHSDKPMSQILQSIRPTVHHFVTEICASVDISVIKWRIVGYVISALWDLCNKSIGTTIANTWLSRR